jgi:hypothetical protein
MKLEPANASVIYLWNVPLRISRSSPLAGRGLRLLSLSIERSRRPRSRSSSLRAGLLERSRLSRRSGDLRRGESRPRERERPRRGGEPARLRRGGSRPPSNLQLADGGVRAHYPKMLVKTAKQKLGLVLPQSSGNHHVRCDVRASHSKHHQHRDEIHTPQTQIYFASRASQISLILTRYRKGEGVIQRLTSEKKQSSVLGYRSEQDDHTCCSKSASATR